MTATYKLTWHGEKRQEDVERAAKFAIDETMGQCVNTAKPLTPVDTGTLQGSIRFEPARHDGDRITGRWGSFDVNYAIYVELGARGRPGRYMLRTAADKEYPQLVERMRRKL